MKWTAVKDQEPEKGVELITKIQHFHTKNTRYAILVKGDFDDHDYEHADDMSELSHDWNVIEFLTK